MKNFKEELHSLSKLLKDIKHPVIGYLMKPLSSKSILKKFAEINLLPTEELVELYVWHNGSNVYKNAKIGDICFVPPGMYFLNLDDAISHYTQLITLPTWNKTWFPVFTNGGGDYLGVILDGKNLRFSPVIDYMRDETEQSISYSSLTSMISLIIKAFKNKIIRLDHDTGWINVDYGKYYEFLKKNYSN